jgi:hypothetical protein
LEKLETLHVSGTPEEIGFAIGQKDAVSIHQQILQLFEFKAAQQVYSGSNYLKGLDAAARKVFPEYVLELEGMAKGAQVDYETLLIWNCRGDLPLLEDSIPESPENVPEGCTTILYPADNGNNAIIAHNEDGPPELNGHCSWLTVHPVEGQEFSAFHYPGMLPGHTFSINAHGLVQTINNIRTDDLQSGVPRHFICRAILDCKTMQEALMLLKRRDRAGGFHHSLGQPSGPSLLSVEAPPSGCVVNKIDSPTTHANHLLDEEFYGVSQTVTASSEFRQQMSEKLLSESTSADAKSILFHHRSKGLSIYRRPNDGVDDYAFTLATAVFEISAESVSWQIHLNKNTTPTLSN